MTASFMIIMVKPFVILLLSLITRMGSINCFLFLNFLDKNQKIKIVFEATGHYGSSLKQFLKAYNFDFMEINSFLIKQFSKASTLRKTKTDKIDSVLIP